MSQLVYSSNPQTLSHKITISSSKISTFIYTLNHINRLSISTSHHHSNTNNLSPLNKTDRNPFNFYPNYLYCYYFTQKIKPSVPINFPPRMATCVHNCDQQQQSQSNHHQFKFKNYRRSTLSPNHQLVTHNTTDHINDSENNDELWLRIVEEAKSDVENEPILSTYYYNSIVSHKSLEQALANHLAAKLSSNSLNSNTLLDLFLTVLLGNNEIIDAVKEDLKAVRERDPACISYVHCILNFKGFLAIQSHRIAHDLWLNNRQILALLIQNRVSEVFAVDIHPGAKIGRGILLDHATGVVVGETAVIGNNVSILHNVTLGGTGKISGDRHPKIGDGVLIGAGTCVLGNVKIGDGAKVGACSLVLKEVPPRTTAVGNPARLIGGKENPVRLDNTPSFTMDHTSHVTEWSDYVI